MFHSSYNVLASIRLKNLAIGGKYLSHTASLLAKLWHCSLQQTASSSNRKVSSWQDERTQQFPFRRICYLTTKVLTETTHISLFRFLTVNETRKSITVTNTSFQNKSSSLCSRHFQNMNLICWRSMIEKCGAWRKIKRKTC